MPNFPRSVRLVVLFCFIAILLHAKRAYATFILVVVKPDAIWVGADSLRSGPSEMKQVCKVHESYGGILLKHGRSNDNDKTFSTDDDVSGFLNTDKSFAQFQTDIARVLTTRVQKLAKDQLNEWKQNLPDEFDGDLLTAQPGLQSSYDVDMGLVFISVIEGKLTIQELYVAPVAMDVSVQGENKRYQWVVPQAVWKIRPSKEEAIIYPTNPLHPRTETQLVSDPEAHILPVMRLYENAYPCVEGPPNLLMEISPAKIDSTKRFSSSAKKKLLNTAVVKYVDPGACPSWEVKPIPRPEGCPVLPR